MSILKKSEKFTQEYCCSIVKIGEVTPIEGSDFLAKTLINFEPIVVRKDQVKEGDILFYVSNECQICHNFLSVNNLYEFGSRELNSNYEEVEKTRETDDAKAKRMVGFFSKTGRVRAIRLRGQISMGYLFGIGEMEKYNPDIASINVEEHLDEDFDMVGDEVFVKAYVPWSDKKPNNHTSQGKDKNAKKLAKLDRMIPGEFAFHYDTSLLSKNIRKINPNDAVTISVKLHGTSLILGNLKVKNFFKLPLFKRWWNWCCDLFNVSEDYKCINYTIGYGDVYASRKVIKNAKYNPRVTDGFYGTNDVWGVWNEKLKGYIQEGMTIYGEIVGYVPGTTKMIQKNYDYGCLPGESKFMPYRITQEVEFGKKYEYDVTEVQEWTEKLVRDVPELKNEIIVIPILYHGTLTNLYPDIPIDEVWHENVVLRMQEDKEHFGMEENEPLNIYHSSMPREGICIRIAKDPIAECFKLKTQKFKDIERKSIDQGNVDLEMEQNQEEEA